MIKAFLSAARIKKFWYENTPKVFLIVVTILIFIAVSGLPYINVYIPKKFFVLIILFITSLVFRVHAKIILLIILILFILSGFFEVIRLKSVSEHLGEVIYFALVYSVIFLIFRYIKDKD